MSLCTEYELNVNSQKVFLFMQWVSETRRIVYEVGSTGPTPRYQEHN